MRRLLGSVIASWRHSLARGVIRAFGAFDAAYYLSAYPDVAASGIDPLEHYCRHGWREGRNPSRIFDTRFYLADPASAKRWVENPLLDWVVMGRFVGRRSNYASLQSYMRGERPGESLPHDIVFVVHDCTKTGAPIFIKNVMAEIKSKTITRFGIIILDSGPLVDEFFNIAPCLPLWVIGSEKGQVLNKFVSSNGVMYLNSVASGKILEYFIPSKGIKIITHVHEIAKSLIVYRYELDRIASICTDLVVVTEDCVIGLEDHFDVGALDIRVIPPAVPIGPLREKGMPASRRSILGCGVSSLRKGTDLFCRLAAELHDEWNDLDMVWVGGLGDFDIGRYIADCGLEGRLRWEKETDPRRYMEEASIFLLPSREDPFPLVCLEAAERAVPIVCFGEEAGGICRLVGNDAGIVVPYMDLAAMAGALRRLLNDPDSSVRFGDRARQKIEQSYDLRDVSMEILEIVTRRGCSAPDRTGTA